MDKFLKDIREVFIKGLLMWVGLFFLSLNANTDF